MNSETDVTIIIPVYNSELFLRDCMESAIIQNNVNAEIICIDDASTDGSRKLLEKYSNYYDGVRIISLRKNSGQATARNLGIKNARGKYLYFMDSDDYLMRSDALFQLTQLANEHEVNAVFFEAETEFEDDECRQYGEDEIITENIADGIYSGMEYFKLFVNAKSSHVAVWRQLWRRDFLISNELMFDEKTSPHEDLLFTFKALLKADKVYSISEILYKYRCRRNSSMTGNKFVKRLTAYIECYKAAVNYLMRDEFRENITDEIEEYLSRIRQSITAMSVESINNGNDINSIFKNDIVSKQIILSKFQHLIRWFKPEEIKCIKSAKRVIIYGDGGAGKDVQVMLHLFGVDQYFIAVSDKSTAGLSKTVYSIREFHYSESVVVLIGAARKHHYEMYELLNSLRARKIICLN